MTKFLSYIVDVKVIFKLAVFITFTTALITFSNWFLSFITQLYSLIKTSTHNITASENFPDLLGCLISITGMDSVITSAFALFFTAMIFWVTAVGYILAYKLGNKVYNGLLMLSS